jgi:hypothetical protein
LSNSDGSESEVLRQLQSSFGAPPIIWGVIDQFDWYGWRRQDGRRIFELYGHVPEASDGDPAQPEWVGNYRAIAVFADGEVLGLNTTGESESQVNIAMKPHSTKVRWFLLRVFRKNDGLTSNEFGPVRLQRVPPRNWRPEILGRELTECEAKVFMRYWNYGKS